VTASRDGVIRSFPNYGLPVRLWASTGLSLPVERSRGWWLITR
jgi:hypothetical protein